MSEQAAISEEMERCPITCNCDSGCIAHAMVRAEREACAKVAEDYGADQDTEEACAAESIAELIRARREAKPA